MMETALPKYSYHTLSAYRGNNYSARYVRGKVASSGSPLYNAARNELYLVPISGLWGTRPLLNLHRSSSSNKMIRIAQEVATDCSTGLHTATFHNPHIARAITRRRDQITTYKQKEHSFLLCQVDLQGNEA